MTERVPELRFRGFEGEWEERSLGKLFDWLRTNSLSREALTDEPQRVQNVHYGDIHQKLPTALDPNNGLPFIRPEFLPKLNGDELLRRGDVLFADASEDVADVGKAVEVVVEPAIATVAGLHTIAARPKPDELAVGFAGRLFTSQGARRAIQRVAQGASIKGISKGSMEGVLVAIPDLTEQREIADALAAVDAKLDALTREREALAEWKRGLAARLFDQTLRFRRDDGTPFPDWEEKRLGEVATFTKGRGVSKADTEEGGATPCIRYAEIYTTYGPVINDIVSTTSEGPDSLLLSRGGEVIVPASGEDASEIATAAVVLRAGIALGGDVNVITSNCNGAFLANYIRHNWRDFARYAQGNSVVHLYGSHLKDVQVRLPHGDEQAKITAALSTVNERLNALDARRSGIARFKNGLLQRLFV